jgi:tyrosine-protein phosphatase SIW14
MTRFNLGRTAGGTITRIALVGLFTAATLFLPQLSRADSAKPVAGLQNFGQVSDTLFRGAQPNLPGFTALKQMGVAIVVNFRNESDEVSAEQHEVESLGIKYVTIPWSGSSEPSNAQVVQFLDLVRANPQVKIFVHCHRGADRTGVMVAAYRLAVQHLTVADAVAEMHKFHYDHLFLPQLERYVKSLPELLQNNPQFSAYAATQAPIQSATPSVPAPPPSQTAAAATQN